MPNFLAKKQTKVSKTAKAGESSNVTSRAEPGEKLPEPVVDPEAQQGTLDPVEPLTPMTSGPSARSEPEVPVQTSTEGTSDRTVTARGQSVLIRSGGWGQTVADPSSGVGVVGAQFEYLTDRPPVSATTPTTPGLRGVSSRKPPSPSKGGKAPRPMLKKQLVQRPAKTLKIAGPPAKVTRSSAVPGLSKEESKELAQARAAYWAAGKIGPALEKKYGVAVLLGRREPNDVIVPSKDKVIVRPNPTKRQKALRAYADKEAKRASAVRTTGTVETLKRAKPVKRSNWYEEDIDDIQPAEPVAQLEVLGADLGQSGLDLETKKLRSRCVARTTTPIKKKIASPKTPKLSIVPNRRRMKIVLSTNETEVSHTEQLLDVGIEQAGSADITGSSFVSGTAEESQAMDETLPADTTLDEDISIDEYNGCIWVPVAGDYDQMNVEEVNAVRVPTDAEVSSAINDMISLGRRLVYRAPLTLVELRKALKTTPFIRKRPGKVIAYGAQTRGVPGQSSRKCLDPRKAASRKRTEAREANLLRFVNLLRAATNAALRLVDPNVVDETVGVNVGGAVESTVADPTEAVQEQVPGE